MRSILLLALSLVLGIVTSTAVYFKLAYTVPPLPVEMVSVVMAKRDLPARTRTTAEDFTTRDFPRDALPPQAITKIEDAIDRTARVEIRAGDPVLGVLLTERGQDSSPADLIPEGMRAFSIRVVDSSTMVEGLIRPGSKVDVCLSMRTPEEEDREEHGGAIARTLLADIEILAVGKQVELGNKEKSTAGDRARSVTVIVKPDEANELALAQNHGALHLTLRGTKGGGNSDVGVTDLRKLKGEAPRPRKTGPVTNVVPEPLVVTPVVPPVRPAPQFKEVDVTLFHGGQRSSSKLSFPLADPTVESTAKPGN